MVQAITDSRSRRGTGYIGSFTSLALLEHGYNVIIIDSLYNSSQVSLDRIELLCGRRPDFYQVDLTDEAAMDKVFAANPEIDSVIHFAALKVRNHLRWHPHLLTRHTGSWRVFREAPRILPGERRWDHLPPTINDTAQCHQHCLLLVGDCVR